MKTPTTTTTTSTPALATDENRPVTSIKPVQEKVFSIRLADWQRLYRKVKEIPEASSFWANAAFATWGVSCTAFFFLLTEDPAVSANPLVNQRAWFIFIGGAVLGTAFMKVSRSKDTVIKSSVKEVHREMKDTHKLSCPGHPIDPDPNDKGI
jgi:hypothetical protein